MKFSSYNASYLVEQILQDPNGQVEFQNVQSAGHDCYKQFTDGGVMGTHSATNEPLVPESGIIMSTGKPREFCYNDNSGNGHDFNALGDAEIESTFFENDPGQTYDACWIEFDFRCTIEDPLVRHCKMPVLIVATTSKLEFDWLTGFIQLRLGVRRVSRVCERHLQ